MNVEEIHPLMSELERLQAMTSELSKEVEQFREELKAFNNRYEALQKTVVHLKEEEAKRK